MVRRVQRCFACRACREGIRHVGQYLQARSVRARFGSVRTGWPPWGFDRPRNHFRGRASSSSYEQARSGLRVRRREQERLRQGEVTSSRVARCFCVATLLRYPLCTSECWEPAKGDSGLFTYYFSFPQTRTQREHPNAPGGFSCPGEGVSTPCRGDDATSRAAFSGTRQRFSNTRQPAERA